MIEMVRQLEQLCEREASRKLTEQESNLRHLLMIQLRKDGYETKIDQTFLGETLHSVHLYIYEVSGQDDGSANITDKLFTRNKPGWTALYT
jgi:hypothetical protein